MKKMIKTATVLNALAEKCYEYSFAAEYNKTIGESSTEAKLREGLVAISELLKELGLREGTDYERVKKEYTRDDGLRFEYWVIKPMA